jgi:hypothetical protein
MSSTNALFVPVPCQWAFDVFPSLRQDEARDRYEAEQERSRQVASLHEAESEDAIMAACMGLLDAHFTIKTMVRLSASGAHPLTQLTDPPPSSLADSRQNMAEQRDAKCESQFLAAQQQKIEAEAVVPVEQSLEGLARFVPGLCIDTRSEATKAEEETQISLIAFAEATDEAEIEREGSRLIAFLDRRKEMVRLFSPVLLGDDLADISLPSPRLPQRRLPTKVALSGLRRSSGYRNLSLDTLQLKNSQMSTSCTSDSWVARLCRSRR